MQYSIANLSKYIHQSANANVFTNSRIYLKIRRNVFLVYQTSYLISLTLWNYNRSSSKSSPNMSAVGFFLLIIVVSRFREVLASLALPPTPPWTEVAGVIEKDDGEYPPKMSSWLALDGAAWESWWSLNPKSLWFPLLPKLTFLFDVGVTAELAFLQHTKADDITGKASKCLLSVTGVSQRSY